MIDGTRKPIVAERLSTVNITCIPSQILIRIMDEHTNTPRRRSLSTSTAFRLMQRGERLPESDSVRSGINADVRRALEELRYDT